MKLALFIEDCPYMLPTKFRFIWPSGFRGEEFKKSANQTQESPVAAMLVNGSGRNEQYLQRTFHRCFLPSFGSFGQTVSEEKIFKNLYTVFRVDYAHPLLAFKISRKKLVRVYNVHGLLKKIVVGNVRIKYQSYIFFSPLSMFHFLGEFKNHLSLFIFNKVAKY
jgi:hypothetical protein